MGNKTSIVLAAAADILNKSAKFLSTGRMIEDDDPGMETDEDGRLSVGAVVHLMAKDSRVPQTNGLVASGVYRVEVPYRDIQETRVIAINGGVATELFAKPE